VSPIYQWLTDLRSLGSAKGSSIDVWWPPTTRDFVMIEDVATALLDLASVEESQGLVNLCSGVGLQFGSIAQAIATELGSSTTVHSLEKPGIETVVGDPGLLRKTIGWVPEMSLEALAARVVGADRVTPPGGGSPANR
jgi:nucleoside-diphosphate-sugar epimerase